MKIFRHCYTFEDARSESLPLIDAYSSFGFVQRDGSPIEWDPEGESIQYFNIRYNYDIKDQYYIQLPIRLGQSSTADSDFLHDYYSVCSNGHSYGYNISYSDGYIYYGNPLHLVFIPLINNGFFINCWQNSTGEGGYTPLPVLHYSGSQGSSRSQSTLISSILGLSPQTQSNWIYLNMAVKNTTQWRTSVLDLGDGRCLTSLPFMSSISDGAENVTQYINVNQNVCSLIKAPYDAGFLDGIYLLATSPIQVKPNTFFSFGGRNFLNVIGNYVVELPSG